MSLDLDERQRAMLQEMQVRVWWSAAPPAAAPAAAPLPASPAPAPDRPAAIAAAPLPDAPAAGAGDLQGLDLPALAQAVAGCAACRLREGRKKAVFAAPAPAPVRQTDWMVVGDPPTSDDERVGSPFAGIEGELLDNMLRAVQCSRSGAGSAGAWLTPVVKRAEGQVLPCAPPDASGGHKARPDPLTTPRVPRP